MLIDIFKEKYTKWAESYRPSTRYMLIGKTANIMGILTSAMEEISHLKEKAK